MDCKLLQYIYISGRKRKAKKKSEDPRGKSWTNKYLRNEDWRKIQRAKKIHKDQKNGDSQRTDIALLLKVEEKDDW